MGTKIKFFNNKNFKKATLIVGLPGIGLVGKICIDYLIKHLEVEKVAEITSDSFPPGVQGVGGVLTLIKDEIYHLKFNGKNFLFLSGPVQPSLDLRQGFQEHFEFSEKIIKSLKEKGLFEVCTLAGLNVGEKRIQHKPRVVAMASDKKIIKEWVKYGVVCSEAIGIISGAAGLLVGVGKEVGIKGICLMGETSVDLIYGDPGAAKKVLEVIVKKYRFNVKMTKIDKESKEIEKTFSTLVKQFENREEFPKELSYVR